ncbi:MAG: c-type cytochrome domain-containing protein [Bacteroidia bacterium]|nr:c-type cytochrome domain-containing protein [Bacteroidia bacterium]
MNYLKNKWILAAACGLIACSACKEETLEEKVAKSGYPSDVGEIMLTSCAVEGCHAGSAPAGGLKLESYLDAFEGSQHGAVLVPGASRWSPLFQHINTYDDLGLTALPAMPPDSTDITITREQVLTIRDWIEEGTPTNGFADPYWYWTLTKNTGKLFTLCAGSDLVAVTDLATHRVMRYVSVGQYPGEVESPHFIALSPDKKYFYLSLIAGNLIEKYRTDTYEMVGRVAVGASPSLIVVSPDGTRAIVTHWNDAEGEVKISLLDVSGTQVSVLDELRAGGSFMSFPHGLKANAAFNTVYVTGNFGNYVSKITFDGQVFTGEEKILLDPVGDPGDRPTQDYLPYQLYLTADEKQIFVSCSKKNEVRVINLETRALEAVIPTGRYPRLMDYDPVSNRLFVACRDESNVAMQGDDTGCVSVIDVAGKTLVKNIFGLGHKPHGIGVAIAGRRLYVSTEGNTGDLHHPISGTSSPPGRYTVVDLTTLTVLEELETQVAEYATSLIISE